MPSIMRAPPEQETTTSGWRVSMASSIPRVTFSPTTAPIEPPINANSIAQQTTPRPFSRPSAVITRIVHPQFFARFLQPRRVRFRVHKLQRVGRRHTRIVLRPSSIQQHFQALLRAHLEMELALRTDATGSLPSPCGKRSCRRTRTWPTAPRCVRDALREAWLRRSIFCPA